MSDDYSQPFFELRQYPLQAGQLDNWVTFMDEILIPFQRSKGMVIVGSWFNRELNQYVWIRRFENEADKDKLYKAAYENETWLEELKPQVNTMIDREKGLVVTRMTPSSLSIIR